MAERPPFFLTGDPQTLPITEGPYAGAELDVLTDVPLGVSGAVGKALAEGRLRSAWLVFAENALTGWNLLDRRGAVPADGAAFERVPTPLLIRAMELWADLMIAKTSEEPDG